jgi:hypothetical protein
MIVVPLRSRTVSSCPVRRSLPIRRCLPIRSRPIRIMMIVLNDHRWCRRCRRRRLLTPSNSEHRQRRKKNPCNCFRSIHGSP